MQTAVVLTHAIHLGLPWHQAFPTLHQIPMVFAKAAPPHRHPMTPGRGLVNTLIELPCEPTANVANGANLVFLQTATSDAKSEEKQSQLSRAISLLRQKVIMPVHARAISSPAIEQESKVHGVYDSV